MKDLVGEGRQQTGQKQNIELYVKLWGTKQLREGHWYADIIGVASGSRTNSVSASAAYSILWECLKIGPAKAFADSRSKCEPKEHCIDRMC